jgi:hypothetical protein
MSPETMKCTEVFMLIAPYFCPSLANSGHSKQISIQLPIQYFHGNPSVGKPSDISKRMDRETDGEGAANSHF